METKYRMGYLFSQCFPQLSLVCQNAVLCGNGLTAHADRWRICVSWLSYTSTLNTTFLSEATDNFSHMLLQRWEAKIYQKESLPQPRIELTTTMSWVRYAHHWATRVGQVGALKCLALGQSPENLEDPVTQLKAFGRWKNKLKWQNLFFIERKILYKKKKLVISILSFSLNVFNSLPNDKIFTLTKLKGFADVTINVTQKLKFVLVRVENIVGKGENAGYQHFLLFPQCFQKVSYTGSLTVGRGLKVVFFLGFSI